MDSNRNLKLTVDVGCPGAMEINEILPQRGAKMNVGIRPLPIDKR